MTDRPDAHLDRRALVAGAALSGAAPLMAEAARAEAPGSRMTAAEIRKLLDLTPNATCGYVRVTFVSKHEAAVPVK